MLFALRPLPHGSSFGFFTVFRFSPHHKKPNHCPFNARLLTPSVRLCHGFCREKGKNTRQSLSVNATASRLPIVRLYLAGLGRTRYGSLAQRPQTTPLHYAFCSRSPYASSRLFSLHTTTTFLTLHQLGPKKKPIPNAVKTRTTQEYKRLI